MLLHYLAAKKTDTKITSFYSNAVIMFCQKHTKHTETITHSQTNHPLISRTSAVCINQNQEREHSTHLSVTFTKSVKTSAAMSKIGITGLFCIKPGVKVNRKSYYLTKCYLLSKTSQVTICFSTGQHTGVLNCVSKKVPTFWLSVTLTNLNHFQNFCTAGNWKAYEICYKTHMTLPTSP